MTVFQALLMVGLVLIAVLHTMSRVGGALATVVWCIAAAVFGAQQFAGVDSAMGLNFAGIQTPQWIFFTAMASVGVYNLAVIARAWRLRPRKRASTTTTTT